MTDHPNPGHPFVRPGQVDPDLPPPDNCVTCGLGESEHRNGYSAEAGRFDTYLDNKIRDIRARQDAGKITVRESADLRVEALSHHLAALKALRAEYFGDE